MLLLAAIAANPISKQSPMIALTDQQQRWLSPYSARVLAPSERRRSALRPHFGQRLLQPEKQSLSRKDELGVTKRVSPVLATKAAPDRGIAAKKS